MSKEKIEQAIKETYTPDRYCKLFLFWWAMVDALTDEFNMDDEVFSWELDDLAQKFIEKLQA